LVADVGGRDDGMGQVKILPQSNAMESRLAMSEVTGKPESSFARDIIQIRRFMMVRI
jgi:hypothetical protein